MDLILIMPRIFSVVLYVLLLSLNVLEAMIPVKECHSLQEFESMHITISNPSLAFQSELLFKKFAKIDTLDVELFNTIKGIREEISSNEASLLKIHQPYMSLPEKTITSAISQLKTKLQNIYKEINLLDIDISSTETSDLPIILEKYKNAFIQNIANKITNGDYSAIFSSLSACLFIESHVPNTFTCALTLRQIDNTKINIFVKNAGKALIATKDPKESFVFTSGEGDFFKSSLLLQSSAIGGLIPAVKMNPVSNTPSDLYRHSEQICFSRLGVFDFVKSVVEIAEKKVIEIIFHGNTLRDMCSNCRATLIAHEMLATKNVLIPSKELPDSFLCALQEGFSKKFDTKPFVTCIISSFVEYDNRKKDDSWCLTPFINLLNFEEKSPDSICSNFVNQFAFSEKYFLEQLIILLRKKASNGKTYDAIINSLNDRYSLLSH